MPREWRRMCASWLRDGLGELCRKTYGDRSVLIGFGTDRGAVAVEVIGGIVQLSGFVPSLDEKNRARDIASRVSGIKDVRNNIALEH